MGNACRQCVDCFVEPDLDPAGEYRPQHGRTADQEARPVRPGHGIPVRVTGFAALARDVLQFETTGQLPDGLSRYVKAALPKQADWYQKVLAVWRRTHPTNADEASRLVLKALEGQSRTDVEGLLKFYQLPQPQPMTIVPAAQAPVATPGVQWPRGVEYELRTLPVTDSEAVGDGDGMTVYVEVLKNTRERSIVPQGVQEALRKRSTAQLQRNIEKAETTIKKANYKIFINNRNEEILVHMYRVRLRGVDAPEIDQPYGPEAKEVLLKLVEGESLKLLVYKKIDHYKRIVADIYCNNMFIQEVLLKQGCVWHFKKYDKRPEFARWEKEARAAQVGLWAKPNPKEPWDYREEHREKYQRNWH